MKIDFSNGINMYRKNNINQARAAVYAYQQRKTDVDEISRGTTAVSGKSLVGLKSLIQRDLSTSASPQRLEELRQAVKSGNYSVQTSTLVDAILNSKD